MSKNKSKKILFVVDERQMGGVSILLSDILNTINIKKYDIDVMILHNNGDYLDNLPSSVNIIYGSSFFDVVDLNVKEVIKTHSIKKILKKIYLVFLMKTKLIGKKIKKERKKCLKEKYDVEIAFKDGFCAIFTAYGDSIKKYHWLHTDYSMYDCTAKYRKLFNEVFLKFDKIIGISKSVLRKFLDIYEVKNTDVIYNLIDKDKILNDSKEFDPKFDNKKINIISIGRFHNMKGYDRLIDVFSKLDENNLLDNVVLRLVGDGPDFNLVKEKIIYNQLEDKIILYGSKKNPFPYVKNSDMFLMCSRYEPFGLVILESMILNVPVISTKIASIDEIMDERYGMIVENSINGLYEGIKLVIDNKKVLDNYKKELKEYKYPTQEIIEKIEKLLEE